MPPPAELGRRAHVPGSGIIDLNCGYGCSHVVLSGFSCVFAGAYFVGLDFIHIYPMEAKSSHLIHVFHVMAMCRTAHVWSAKDRFLSVLF
jgi:hypothetical protein